MKKFGVILLLLSVLLLLCACAPCAHTDGDKNYICDDCGAELERSACPSHEDAECDGICDICDRVVKIEHIDRESDGVCDKCRGCIEHIDNDCSGSCDRCSATVRVEHIGGEGGTCEKCGGCTEHSDTDCNAFCDRCSATLEVGHIDADGDELCDKCRACVSHIDYGCDGGCDRCGATVTIIHKDITADGVCDKCKRCTGEHTDGDCDGVCDKDKASMEITHIDKNKDDTCDKCKKPICIHEYENGSEVCSKCGKVMEKISYTASKRASLAEGRTIYPAHSIKYSSTTYRGGRVQYTFSLKNTGNVALSAYITDKLPEGTKLISGCENVEDGVMMWSVALQPGEEKQLCYTLEVTSLETGVILGANATVNGEALVCRDIYIAPTLNEIDERYISKAINILASSTYTALDFAKHAYTVAFTNGKAITNSLTKTPSEILDSIFSGDAALALMVAPGMYGGRTQEEKIDAIPGELVSSISEDSLVCGDIIITSKASEWKMYIYAEGKLYDITGRARLVNTAATLGALGERDRYAVLRPSLTMTGFTPSNPDEQPIVLNSYQEALVREAEAYLLRGERLQYDDTRFGLTGSSSTNTSGEYRWQIGQKVPEDYTSMEWGYLNCAAFTYEVYRTALGYTLPDEMYTTYNLTKYAAQNEMSVFSFEREREEVFTEEEQLEIEREFMATLEPGDIMVRRHTNPTTGSTSGHAMLYVGGGRFIHSGGGSYSTKNGVGYEVYEPTIRCHKVHDYLFGTATTSMFNDEYNIITIVRPLKAFDGEIPDVTRTRVEKMQDILVEKTSSHCSSTTVNPGGVIAYSFNITNFSQTERVIDLLDKVPAGTEYIGGAEGVNGGVLSWSVRLAAGESATVCYTVKVNEEAEDGTFICGTDATACGIPVMCPGIYVKRTLTENEQAAILGAVEDLRSEGTTLTELALANEIYKRALGIDFDVFRTMDIDEVMVGADGVFVTSTHKIGSKDATEINPSESAYYRSMLAEGLYGGYRVYSGHLKNDRTRLLREGNLVVGDVLIGRTSSAVRAFIYLGSGVFVQLHGTSELPQVASFSTLCENIMYFGRDFAVLRPSIALD